jgi:DnaK suppressor protein
MSRPNPGSRAKVAKATPRVKTEARVGATASRPASKPVAKAKPVTAKATKVAVAKKAAVTGKAPAKPVVKKAENKALAKPVAKAATARPVPAKKAAPAKPVAKVAAKPVVPKKVPPAAAVAEKPISTAKERKFVTTSKTEASAALKGASKTPADNGVTMQDGRYALPITTQIELPKGYKPSANEEYMSPRQLQYFRSKLSQWREELVEESRQTIESLRDEVRDVGDEAERATRETENSLELRTRDRYRKLIAKIDKALKRIEEGRYGYCEETDEEIGIDRLEARPIATLSLDAQERWEHRQKQMGD